MIRKFFIIMFAFVMLLISVCLNQAYAAPLTPWTGSGLGTITFSDGITNSPSFTYSLNPAGLNTTRTWNYHTTANADGPVMLGYTYTGLHAWFQVTVFLRAYVTHNAVTTYYPLISDGPANCCTPPSNGFSYTGSQELNVSLGDEYGFEFGGSNYDAINLLSGTLSVNSNGVYTIPTINEWGMLIFSLFAGLGSIYYLRRKKITG